VATMVAVGFTVICSGREAGLYDNERGSDTGKEGPWFEGPCDDVSSRGALASDDGTCDRESKAADDCVKLTVASLVTVGFAAMGRVELGAGADGFIEIGGSPLGGAFGVLM
jgi:hypothetical protein